MTAALNKFISRSAYRCKPFFLLMNKWKGFKWTEECECALAFQQLKEYLSRPPIMSSPEMDMIIYNRGIEVNPDQVKVINNLQPPRNPKEVQKLTKMTATLNKFISRSTYRCRPFFPLMNKLKGFEWNEECTLAFQQFQEYLSRPPIMSSPGTNEVLFSYITVAPHVVSLVLIRVIIEYND